VLIDGAAGKVVTHGDFAVRLRALRYRIDLLMVPTVRATSSCSGGSGWPATLIFNVGGLLGGNLLLERLTGEWRNIEGCDLRLRVCPIGVQLDAVGLELHNMGRVIFCASTILAV